MNIRSILTLIFVLLLASQGLSFAVNVGQECPKFELKIIDGPKVQSDRIKGKSPLLLVFWATWCTYCKDEIPKLKKIFSEFEPKGVEVIAINPGVNDSLDRIKQFIKKYKISYPVAFDEESKTIECFKIIGLPTVIIIDKDGIIRYRAHELPEGCKKYFEGTTK